MNSNKIIKSPIPLEIRQNGVEVEIPVDTIDFIGSFTITTDGEGKVTVADPFEYALFSQGCDLLFEKRADGSVTLLVGCP